jgi:hypothetical protein
VVQHQEGEYFRRLVDHVHLNPVRAGLIESGEGFDSWEWTSLRDYRKPPSKRFEWMETGKGFEAVSLKDTSAGRRRNIEPLGEADGRANRPRRPRHAQPEEQDYQSSFLTGAADPNCLRTRKRILTPSLALAVRP